MHLVRYAPGCAETLCIHDLDLFDECLKEPDDQEIEEELSQVIYRCFYR